MSEIELGTGYLLSCADEEYFDAIKPNELYLSKLNRLKDYLPEAGTLVSLGMAGGEDICALANLYGVGTRLIGIDISPVALERSRKTTSAAGVTADFIEGNATELTIPDRSIDGFVVSAMLHEVYSYADDGKESFIRTIEGVCRTTSEGGCILISDFAAPRIEGHVTVQTKTEEAEHFLDYFMKNFRKFNDVLRNAEKPLIPDDHRHITHGFRACGLLGSSPAFASEVLWHFKHYRKNIDHGPQDWKEINEVYLPPNPLVLEDESMPIDEYARTVVDISQNSTIPSDVPLKCKSAVLTPQRPGILDMLDEHFSVSIDDDAVSSKSLIRECTNWMDLIFKKEPI